MKPKAPPIPVHPKLGWTNARLGPTSMGFNHIRKGHRMPRIPIEGGKGTVGLRGDGVVHLIWTPNARIDVADARAAMAMVNEVCDGVGHPMLVDMASTETVSREARAV